MKTPTEIIAERIGAHEAKAVVDLLRETGWIIVRHDAIRRAQADEAAAVKQQERDWLNSAHVIVNGVTSKDFVLYQPFAKKPQRMEINK